jgi:RNA polymerase subunit RPABC4/transcription elongation factor Spt4
VNPIDQFCPECGESLHGFTVAKEWVCSYCHHLVEEKAKFCPHCGEVFDQTGDIRYWCNDNELDQIAFENLKQALGIPNGENRLLAQLEKETKESADGT